MSLISLIFQWKHSNYLGVDVLFRSPIKHKDTSILLQSIKLLGDLSHDFDLLWFLSAVEQMQGSPMPGSQVLPR